MTRTEKTRNGVVLVVDDERLVRELIKNILARDGYVVHAAEDGEQGVAMAGDLRPDVIIMDITMPGIDGYEATEQIRLNSDLAKTPVVFLTGTSAAEDGGSAFESGGASYCRKPLTARQIRQAVEAVLTSRSS